MKYHITVYLLILPFIFCSYLGLKTDANSEVIKVINKQESVKHNNEDSISVKEEGNSEIFTDSRDGKKYRTVKIGDQIWMAENLNYSSGTCYKKEDANCDRYGRLYTWKDALDASPEGWHLPSKEEWQTLTVILVVRAKRFLSRLFPVVLPV